MQPSYNASTGRYSSFSPKIIFEATSNLGEKLQLLFSYVFSKYIRILSLYNQPIKRKELIYRHKNMKTFRYK